MAKQFLTFAFVDSNGEYIKQAWVRVFGADGTVLVDTQFQVYSTLPTPTLVELHPGSYSAHVRADGHQFAYPSTFTVAEDDGPTPSSFRVVTFTAVEDVSTTPLPYLVTGKLPTVGASSGMPPLLGFGIAVRSEAGSIALHDHNVSFTRIDPVGSQSPQLTAAETIYVALDRSGRFEALLQPTSLYRISAPGIRGSPYLRTGIAGATGDVHVLIAESISASPYDLVRT